jgi:hypothetical protein
MYNSHPLKKCDFEKPAVVFLKKNHRSSAGMCEMERGDLSRPTAKQQFYVQHAKTAGESCFFLCSHPFGDL